MKRLWKPLLQKWQCNEVPKRCPYRRKVIKTFENLGFRIARMGEHISMVRENPDGTKTPLTMPNHDRIKGSTLRVICRGNQV